MDSVPPAPPVSTPAVIPQPQPVVQPPQSKNKVWMWIVAGIVLLGVGIVSGVLLGKQLYSTPQPQPVPIPLPPEASAKEGDPTANWKTYTDTEAGFSLKYPNDYFIFQGDPSSELPGFFAATSQPQGGVGSKFLPNNNDIWLGAYGSKNTNFQTIDQYLTSNQDSFNVATKISTTIGGMNGYKVVSTIQSYCAGDSCTTIYVYDGLVFKNNSIYTISMSSLDQSALYANETMFNQILSTFKFTSGTPVDFRKERIFTANRQGQQNQCYAVMYENTRSICKSQTGFDPGPADGSGVKDWITLTDEEKAQEVLFWQCYDRVSASEAQKCVSKYPDVTKKRNTYYDCLAKGVDVGKYCGDTTGYTQANNFPSDVESKFWQCMEVTRIEKETRCATESGYNPN